MAAAVYAADDSKSAIRRHLLRLALPRLRLSLSSICITASKFVDNYRWLEDGTSAETQKWVADGDGYTRALLDPLPGRDAIHKRLTELLSIGNISAPQMAGKHYFYIEARRDAEPAHPLRARRTERP